MSTTLVDLPLDILLLIVPYLDVPSFTALTATCKALHNPDFAQDSSYWSSTTRSTFRVPNQPVVENDGKRWQRLYKRLLTQSRVYTWGNNEKACLGHSYQSPAALGRMPPHMRRRVAMRGRHVSWPTEMEEVQDLGIIADMQCGGWSTNLLTSKGVLYSVGVLDGLQFNQRQPPYMQTAIIKPQGLRYPPGFPNPSDRYDPVTAVRQFSAGRSHVLALSDSGRIWSWNNIEHAALHVKFLTVDLKESARSTKAGAVKKVVAGWNKSAALVAGTGIVLWDPLSRSHDETEIEDAALVLETATVPHSGHERESNSVRVKTRDAAADTGTGEVLNFICLEHFVVFSTHTGKIFAAKITWDDRQQPISDIFEITLSATQPSANGEAPFATDVQGSFRSFAIFTRDGAVLTGDQDHLEAFCSAIPNPPSLRRIPALQNTQVISIAFGDYHFHALHASGHITSYGTEPQGCGALGLGGHGDPEGRLRGIRYQGVGGDGRLVPHAYTTGRQVWFEKEKRNWITFVTSGGKDPEEARERMRMCADTAVQGEVSEWIEQEGRAWEERFGGGEKSGEDDLGAFFALSVTAAGWHSGALVLVNDEAAQRIHDSCIIHDDPVDNLTEDVASSTLQGNANDQQEQQQRGFFANITTQASDWGRWFLGLPTSAEGFTRNPPLRSSPFNDPVNHGAASEEGGAYKWVEDRFPRLRLADGREMPGSDGFDEWRYGRPEWDLQAGM